MILLTGATGTVGSEVVKALLPAQAGRVRALTRNPDAVFPEGVHGVVADLGDGDLAPALDSVTAVFLVTDGLNIAGYDRRVIAAAKRAGVKRIVKLSVRNVGHEGVDAISRLHRAGEQAVRDSGLGWTILRPTAFMSNALNWAGMIPGQVVYAPFADGRAAVVDPADIAAVAAACLTEDGHEQRVYELTGPEPLSPGDQVALLGKVLGADLRYVEVDPEGTIAQWIAYGMPEEYARAVIELFRSTTEPFAAEPTGDVTAVTGRPARTFADWAEAHRAAFPAPEDAAPEAA